MPPMAGLARAIHVFVATALLSAKSDVMGGRVYILTIAVMVRSASVVQSISLGAYGNIARVYRTGLQSDMAYLG